MRSSSVVPAGAWTTSRPALRPARSPAGDHDAPERREQVVGEVGDHGAPLAGRPRSSRAGRGGGRGRARTGSRPAGGSRRRAASATAGARCDGPRAAGDDDEVRARASARVRGGRQRADRGRPGRPPSGAAHRRRARRPTGRAAARAAGRAAGAGRARRVDQHERPRRRSRRRRIGRDERRARRRSPARGRTPRAGTRRSAPPRAAPGVEADLDRLDPPVEDVGQRPRWHGRCARRASSAGSASSRAGVGQRARRAARRPRPPARAASLGRAVIPTSPNALEMLGHGRAEPQDDRQLGAPARRRGRDEGGQLADDRALVGRRRIAGADEDGADVVREAAARVISSGSAVSALAERTASRRAVAAATSAGERRARSPPATASRRGRTGRERRGAASGPPPTLPRAPRPASDRPPRAGRRGA